MNRHAKPRTLGVPGSAGSVIRGDAQTGVSPCDSIVNHDLDNAIKKGRATWFCPKCGDDVSMAYLYYQMALQYGGEV